MSIIRIASFVSVIGLLFYMSAAEADSISANSIASVISPISVVETTGLDFGAFSSPTSSGTVVREIFSRSVTGGIELISADQGSPANFTTSGEPLAIYSTTLPVSTTVTKGIDTMTVNNFVFLAPSVLISLVGTSFFVVGATLEVGADQPTGTYTGTYQLSVIYD